MYVSWKKNLNNEIHVFTVSKKIKYCTLIINEKDEKGKKKRKEKKENMTIERKREREREKDTYLCNICNICMCVYVCMYYACMHM